MQTFGYRITVPQLTRSADEPRPTSLRQPAAICQPEATVTSFASSVARLIALALATCLITGCENAGNQKVQVDATGRPPLSVNVMRATAVENALKTEVCFGKLMPQRQARLTFGQPGQVASVLKQVGDKCAAGEKLAALATPQLNKKKSELTALRNRLQRDFQAAPQGTASALTQQIQAAEAQLAEVDGQIGVRAITAPFPCLVTARNVDDGMLVSPAVTAFSIVEDAPPHVATSLPQRITQELDPDQSIWVGIGNTAVVSHIKAESLAQDTAGQRSVLLMFQDDLPVDSWSFGQVVEVRFFAQTTHSGYWIPRSALQRIDGEQWAVNVVSKTDVDSPTIIQRTADVLHLEDDFAVVSTTLNEGDRVVVNGGHRIVAGQQVTPVDISDQMQPPFRPGVTE